MAAMHAANVWTENHNIIYKWLKWKARNRKKRNEMESLWERTTQIKSSRTRPTSFSTYKRNEKEQLSTPFIVCVCCVFLALTRSLSPSLNLYCFFTSTIASELQRRCLILCHSHSLSVGALSSIAFDAVHVFRNMGMHCEVIQSICLFLPLIEVLNYGYWIEKRRERWERKKKNT